MQVYTVHERAWSAAADRDAVLVREGFAWGAALLSFLWALAHRMWLAAAGLVALELAFAALLGAAARDDPAPGLILLAARLAVGFAANDWRRAALKRAGYVMTGIVAAPNRDAAECKYLATAALGPTAYE